MAFLFVLYLAVLALFPKNFNLSALKTQIEAEIHRQTGLTAGIENIAVKTSLTPYINIQANHVILLYPDKKEMLKIKDVNLKVEVLPIVFKKIKIDKISINRPILSFTIDKNGKCTLDEYLNKKYKQQNGFSGFTVDEKIPDIVLNRYKIKIYDSKYKNPFIAEGEKLKIEQAKTSSKGIKTVLKGVLKYNDTPYINYNTEIETNFAEVKKQIFDTNPFEYIRKFAIQGNINSKIVLNKTADGKIKTNGFADIDKLSFIINNKTLKDNFINLKFGDNKLSVDADLKTGLQDRIKVNGTTTLGQNPNVNMKCLAKDIDLQNLSETLNNIFSAFNIKNVLTPYNITGKANFDFKIKGNKKSIQSQGFAEVINASVKGKDIPYLINGINSKINLNNNTIKIEPSEMLVNGTAIKFEGTVDSKTNLAVKASGNNLSAEKLSKIFLPEDIKKDNDFRGILDFTADIKGNFKEPNPVIYAKLKNFVYKNKGLAVINSETVKINVKNSIKEPEGTIELINAYILPKDFLNNLKTENLKISFEDKSINIKDGKMLFGGSPFNLSAQITDYQTENPAFNMDFSGKFNSSAIYEVIKSRKEFENFQAAAKGNLSAKGTISGKIKNVILKTEILSDKDNYLSCLVIKEILNQPSKTILEATIKENGIELKDFSISPKNQNGAKILAINGKINNPNNPQLQGLKISIPKSMTFAVSELKNSEITIKSDLTLNGNINEPEMQGSLEIKDIKIPEYKIRSSKNNITFEKNNIKVSVPNLEIGSSKFDVTAILPSKFTKNMQLSELILKADVIDLDELNETFANLANDPVYPGVNVPLNTKSGKAVIKTFRTGGLQAENVKCDISIENNVMKMTNISGTAYKGTITGKSEYNFLQTSTKSEINGQNADMRSLLKALTGKDDETTGLVDYKVKINAIGTKQIQQLRTAKGYAEFNATKGVLGPLCQFEHFLYAQNLISQSILKTTVLNVSKVIKPKNTGIYTTAKGNVEISGENAYLKPVTVEGPNMSLYITGKLNALNDLADIKIYGRISQEIEKSLG
ncbi:MAG: AsmA family protein, partial [Candidatus Gastranaerophilales bacterium]|nr:AsmA family protein [Candidatus Gastranaerophilales bacterium]